MQTVLDIAYKAQKNIDDTNEQFAYIATRLGGDARAQAEALSIEVQKLLGKIETFVDDLRDSGHRASPNQPSIEGAGLQE
jgi:acyl-CoA reductase-like NAD-dependent aldehyde dehydrogenase